MAGVTPTGFEAETFETLLTQLEAELRELFGLPTLDVRDPHGVLASIYLPLIKRFAALWELGEIIYNSPDPRRSTDQAYAIVAALRGVVRKTPKVGKHEGVSMSFSGAVGDTIDRGAIRFHVQNQPGNVWINSEDTTIGAPGSYLVPVESELPGSSKILLAAAVVEIVDAPTELTGITVPTTATPGTDLELESNWRQRSDLVIREEQTDLGRSLETNVQGVNSARVIETAGYVQVVISDDGAVPNATIAEAIQRYKVQGVLTLGAIATTIVTDDGESVQVRFDRAASTPVHVIVSVKAPLGASVSAIKDAIRAAAPTKAGSPAVYAKLYAAAATAPGVTDVLSFLTGLTDPPVGAVNLEADTDSLLTIASGDIDVTISA